MGPVVGLRGKKLPLIIFNMVVSHDEFGIPCLAFDGCPSCLGHPAIRRQVFRFYAREFIAAIRTVGNAKQAVH